MRIQKIWTSNVEKENNIGGENLAQENNDTQKAEHDETDPDQKLNYGQADKEDQKRENRRNYMRNYRAKEKTEDKQKRREKDKNHKASVRLNEDVEESLRRKEKDKNQKVSVRAREAPSESVKRREKNMNRMSRKRMHEEEEETIERREKDKQSKRNRIQDSYYLARHVHQVLAGEQIVPDLTNTDETIGRMDTICDYCKALKFKNETASLCCNTGKVDLSAFPPPPQLIQNLLTEHTTEAKLFRENSRSFNNALALSSIIVNERKFTGGYNPSVIFEGKVTQLYGPLLPEEGEEPKFAQLYVHDPSTEHTMRVRNMCLPTSLNKKQINIITNTVQKLQNILREINPFVKDFLHICEIPDDDLKHGKIVLTCKKADLPKDAHERRYNEQTSLSEVSILTNSVPGDLILRKRGGGLQQIYDLHPDAPALHFVLLFPYGTPGYSEFLRHTDSTKRVSPREFFAFHLNTRYL